MKKPEVDLSECIRCCVCVDVCPEVFEMIDAGYIDVKEKDSYPIPLVEEAIRCCPADCIEWRRD
jgi:ferredoxin